MGADAGVVVDQLMPVPPGSASLSVTLKADPGPSFVTVTSKPMFVPAFTGPAGFATFAIRSTGGTRALGWIERSWLAAPPPSRLSVRMCHGAPLTSPAPFGAFG